MAQEKKMEDKPKKSLFKRLITKRRLVILAVILVLFIGFRYFRTKNNAEEFDVYTVSRGDLVQTINASGEVKAQNHADMVFVQPGEIQEIYVQNAQWVTKGTKIAKVDTNKLYQAYEAADADLRNAQATLDRVYDDIKDDGEAEDWEERETRTAAETAKDKAYRAFVIAQINLSQGMIVAPFDGVVTINDGSSEGSFGSTVTKSFSVTDPSTVYISAEVDETDVNSIRTGMKALVELDAFEDELFEQEVQYVNFTNSFNSSGGTVYGVGVSLPDNPDMRYRLGMNGNVHFVLDTVKDVLNIPQSALVSDNGDHYVWVLEGSNVTKRTVETGEESDENVEITSGLREGEMVVIRPSSDLSEGTTIKVAK